MEIKDLLGLSKPIVKLIDVIARGLGAVTRPMLIRSEADAKAYEIQTITAAMKNAGVDKLQYKNGIVVAEDKDGKAQLAELTVDKRADLRIGHEEIRKQQNIENVIVGAAEILSARDDGVNDKSVEQDWINEFFDKVRLVSSLEMQMIWSKILAGEVSSPGTYSIRTMNILKQMTKEEAELFTRIAEVRLDQTNKNDCFAFNGNQDGLGNFGGGLSFENIQALESIGLLYTSLGLGLNFSTTHVPQKIAFEHGSILLAIECDADKTIKALPIIGFTKSGYELSRLIEVKVDMETLKHIKSFVQSEGIRVKAFDIVNRMGSGRYMVGSEREL